MPAFPADAHLKGGQNAAPVLAQLAREFYAPIIPVVLELHGQGLSLRAIARELESRGIRPRYGGHQARWSAAQVRRVVARALAAGESPHEPQHPPVCDTVPPASQQTPTAVPSIHLLIDQADKGPYSTRQVEAMLNAGEITPATLYRRAGGAEWKPLETIIVAPGATGAAEACRTDGDGET
jgi:GYF domain 2/Recombinase